MKNRKNWWEDLQTRQDFVNALPMFIELESIMNTSLFISRTLARQTKERSVIKALKTHSNIPLKRIKEIVKGKSDNNLDLSYTSYMYLRICDENGYLDAIYGLDGLSEEGQQVMMFLEYWDSI